MRLPNLPICFACGCLLVLPSCSSRQPLGAAMDAGPIIDLIPHWMGGEPDDVPPRPGTREYDTWQAQRAQDAAAIKSSATEKVR
jgi:hypothetical protein